MSVSTRGVFPTALTPSAAAEGKSVSSRAAELGSRSSSEQHDRFDQSLMRAKESIQSKAKADRMDSSRDRARNEQSETSTNDDSSGQQVCVDKKTPKSTESKDLQDKQKTTELDEGNSAVPVSNEASGDTDELTEGDQLGVAGSLNLNGQDADTIPTDEVFDASTSGTNDDIAEIDLKAESSGDDVTVAAPQDNAELDIDRSISENEMATETTEIVAAKGGIVDGTTDSSAKNIEGVVGSSSSNDHIDDKKQSGESFSTTPAAAQAKEFDSSREAAAQPVAGNNQVLPTQGSTPEDASHIADERGLQQATKQADAALKSNIAVSDGGSEGGKRVKASPSTDGLISSKASTSPEVTEEALQPSKTSSSNILSNNQGMTKNSTAGQETVSFHNAMDKALLDDTQPIKPSSVPAAATKPESGAAFATQTLVAVGGRVAVPVDVKFGGEKWSGLVADRTASLVMQNVQTAQLQLDPPELGPLTVKIQVQQDQAVVHFTAANPAAKDALDSTLVKLREMLQEQGIQLADSSVSDQSQQKNKDAQTSQTSFAKSRNLDSEVPSSELVAQSLTVASGIDYFV